MKIPTENALKDGSLVSRENKGNVIRGCIHDQFILDTKYTKLLEDYSFLITVLLGFRSRSNMKIGRELTQCSAKQCCLLRLEITCSYVRKTYEHVSIHEPVQNHCHKYSE